MGSQRQDDPHHRLQVAVDDVCKTQREHQASHDALGWLKLGKSDVVVLPILSVGKVNTIELEYIGIWKNILFRFLQNLAFVQFPGIAKQ